jgi:hypothetical protein
VRDVAEPDGVGQPGQGTRRERAVSQAQRPAVAAELVAAGLERRRDGELPTDRAQGQLDEQRVQQLRQGRLHQVVVVVATVVDPLVVVPYQEPRVEELQRVAHHGDQRTEGPVNRDRLAVRQVGQADAQRPARRHGVPAADHLGPDHQPAWRGRPQLCDRRRAARRSRRDQRAAPGSFGHGQPAQLRVGGRRRSQ